MWKIARLDQSPPGHTCNAPRRSAYWSPARRFANAKLQGASKVPKFSTPEWPLFLATKSQNESNLTEKSSEGWTMPRPAKATARRIMWSTRLMTSYISSVTKESAVGNMGFALKLWETPKNLIVLNIIFPCKITAILGYPALFSTPHESASACLIEMARSSDPGKVKPSKVWCHRIKNNKIEIWFSQYSSAILWTKACGKPMPQSIPAIITGLSPISWNLWGFLIN